MGECMNELKENMVRSIVDKAFKQFAINTKERHLSEKSDPLGAINKKKNNIFIKELGFEFMFYSAFMRSFDSSLGSVLEDIGRQIAQISYQVEGKIESYILPSQLTKIQELIDGYGTDAKNRIKPEVSHYATYDCLKPKNVESYYRVHQTDNYFYNLASNEHYIIELKAGGDLDNKKAIAEKKEVLTEYFLLKNKLGKGAKIKIYFATAYNKDGEGNVWKQVSVRNCFADEELLIGKDYWNFVCNDPDGYEVVADQYAKSAHYLMEAINDIKEIYVNSEDEEDIKPLF